MSNISTVLFVLLIVVVPAGQAVSDEVNDLAAESLAVYQRVEEIKARKGDATREQTKRITEINSRRKELRPEIVQKYQRRIEQFTVQIERVKEKIAQLQGKIEAFEKADPDEMKAQDTRLSGELGDLQAEQRRLALPFDEQIETVKRTVSGKKEAYEQAIGKHILIPGKPYAEVAKRYVLAPFGGTIIACNWKNAEGKDLAWSHIRLRDKPAIHSRLPRLDETFLVTSHSNDRIWVWAGHFQVIFVVKKKEWQGKENVAEAVKAFVDLKGLAEIDATEKPKEEAKPN